MSGSELYRDDVARKLYLDRTADDAAHRASVNVTRGSRDLVAELIDVLQLAEGQALVDVGCGAGLHLERFAAVLGSQSRVKGYDFAKDAVEATRQRGLSADVADAAQLPDWDETYDRLNAAYMAYYLSDVDAAVAEWKRVVRKGGRIVVCGPAKDTNRELYEFHEQATGQTPSDADRMALGFVEDQVRRAGAELGLPVLEHRRFENVVSWSEVSEALAYWQRSSLFLRTVKDPPTALEEGRRILNAAGGLSIRKVTDIIALGVP